MAVELQVDVARAVALALRASVELDGLADRIYTATPANVGGDPFVLVRRVGGDPVLPRPAVLDAAELQVDCYGGSLRDSSRWARRVAAVLELLEGELVDDGEWQAVVAGVRPGPLRELPDEVFEPSRPRHVLDFTVFARRAGAVPPGSSRTPAAVTAGAGSSSTNEGGTEGGT